MGYHGLVEGMEIKNQLLFKRVDLPFCMLLNCLFAGNKENRNFEFPRMPYLTELFMYILT